LHGKFVITLTPIISEQDATDENIIVTAQIQNENKYSQTMILISF